MAGINMTQLAGTGSARAASAAKTSASAASRESSQTDFASMIQGRVKEQAAEEPESSKTVKSQDESAGSAGRTEEKQETKEKDVKAQDKSAKAEEQPAKAEEPEQSAGLAELQAALSQMLAQNLGVTEELTEQLTASAKQLEAVAQGKVLEQVEEAVSGGQEEENIQVAVDKEAMADHVTGSLKNFESVASVAEAVEPVRTAGADTEEKPVQAAETPAAQVWQSAADSGIQAPAVEASREPVRQESGEQNSQRDSQSQEHPGSVQELMASGMTGSTSPESLASVELPREETITVPTTPETFPQDVGNRLAASLPKTDGTLTIELEPASLGRMTIKVVYEAGKAAVSIISANPKTVELLSQNAGEIARILEERTGQVTQVYTPDPRQPLEDGQTGQERQERRQENPEKQKHDETESFTQMLRLGLV